MLRRSLLSLLIPVVLSSCNDATGPRNLLGTWRLESVGGQPLPHILEQSGTRKVELTGETVTMLVSGRQTMVTSFRTTEGSNVSTESIPASGNYTVHGSTVLFTFDTYEDKYTATVNGDLMTMDDYVYRRD